MTSEAQNGSQGAPQNGPRKRPAAQLRNVMVSIIVPVFNVAEYLDACITSIAVQTHKAIEVILVDDGSTKTEATRRASALGKPLRMHGRTAMTSPYPLIFARC